MKPALSILLLLWFSWPISAGRAQTRTTKADEVATAWLIEALKDPRRADNVLAALRSAGEDELVPLFAALSRSGDKRMRLMAATALGRMGKPQVTAALKERLRVDTQMVVRAEALVHLLRMKALTADELRAVLAYPDQNLRCMAARAMVQMGRTKDARAPLAALTASKDRATSGLARMSLLGTGDASQMTPLRKLLRDPKAPDAVVALLMEQIVEERIAAALPLAVYVAETSKSSGMRILAYKAIAAVSPQGATVLRDAIGGAKGVVRQIPILHAMASRKDASAHLSALSRRGDVVGALAAYELARRRGGAGGAAAGRRALASRHPIVIEYLLDRARTDIAANTAHAALHAAILLEIVRGVETRPKAMGQEHVRAAQAVQLLVDLGERSSLAALRQILSGRRSAVVKAVAAGLRWSRNPRVCNLARPLLNNAYEDLMIDGAMTLGYFGKPEATDALLDVVRRAERHGDTLVTLACWYLLKIRRQQARAVARIIPHLP